MPILVCSSMPTTLGLYHNIQCVHMHEIPNTMISGARCPQGSKKIATRMEIAIGATTDPRIDFVSMVESVVSVRSPRIRPSGT